MHEIASRALFEASTRLLTPELCGLRGWVIQTVEYPVVDVTFGAPAQTPLRLLLRCEDWNTTPMSVELQDREGRPLAAPPPAPGGQFNPGPHRATGRPFVCMRGTREYHTHESHVGDLWSNYKDMPEFTLGSVLTQIWNAWSKGSS